MASETFIPPVVEYGVRATTPKNLGDLKTQLHDTHKTGVAMGAAGPFVLLGAFFSSSAVLLARSVRRAAIWVEQTIRPRHT